MDSKDIRIHKATASQIKIVNYANQNSIHMAADKLELKQNLLEIAKTVAGVAKNVRQICQKYSSSWKKSRNWWRRKWNSWLDTNQWSLGINVSSWEVIIKACSLNNTLKFKTLKLAKMVL